MKNQDLRSMLYAGCALGIAIGCAAAPLGCSSTCGDATAGADCTPGPETGGAGGTGGVGGAAGTGGSTGDACGGFASLRCPEPNATFCDFPDKMACGQTDATGMCAVRPDTCTEDCPGVCGCDGKFYCNACLAHRAGTDDVPMGTCSDASHAR